MLTGETPSGRYPSQPDILFSLTKKRRGGPGSPERGRKGSLALLCSSRSRIKDPISPPMCTPPQSPQGLPCFYLKVLSAVVTSAFHRLGLGRNTLPFPVPMIQQKGLRNHKNLQWSQKLAWEERPCCAWDTTRMSSGRKLRERGRGQADLLR